MAAAARFPEFSSEESHARFLAAYDAALADWPVAYQALDVPTRLGTTRVIASGSAGARPLLLLPSFAGTAVVWRLNVEALSQRFRTYAVDVIGQPGKSAPVRRLRGPRDYAAWLADLMDGLEIERASIVGCSFGGFLALNQAVATPDRVDRLVLISPVASFASQRWRLIWAMRVRAPLLRLARRLTGRTRKPSLADLSPRARPQDAKWAALIGATMTERPKVSVIDPPVFSTARLRAIRAPTLLLIGELETLYGAEPMLRLVKARMPQLETALVPGADHIAAMAQPEDVGARILAFLVDAPSNEPEPYTVTPGGARSA